jgi:orotidine-5'-phosphate decarboxylase
VTASDRAGADRGRAGVVGRLVARGGAASGGAGRLCAALDVPDAATAHALARRLAGHVGWLKVGLELFVADGHTAIEAVRRGAPGTPLFLDLKLCDIPETVARAVRSAARVKPQLLTVHATGGRAMMQRAVDAAAEESGGTLQVLAVTVLTSLDEADLADVGFRGGAVADQAIRLAHLAWSAGVRGFVCSPREVPRFRAELPEALLVTPGVRPSGAPATGDDQKRIQTPGDAIRAGADLLVVGRPLRDAADPVAAAAAMASDVAAALAALPPASAPGPADGGA